MIEFLDGPAKGATLTLRRAPMYLRVVYSGRAGSIDVDALDQLSDMPNAAESIVAYRRVGKAGSVHINAGRCGRSGVYATARYEVVNPQPDDTTLRERERWREWAMEQHRAEMVTS